MQGAKRANWLGTQRRMSASRIRSQVGIKTRENAAETKCISRRSGTLAQKKIEKHR